MAKILSGREVREARLTPLVERIKSLAVTPCLAIIQVGNRADSTAFIKAKMIFAARIGVKEKLIQVPENVTQAELTKIIEDCNEDPSIHGIIVQLPLPIHLDRDAIIETIDPEKDVDGLTSTNVKRWLEGRADAVMPATARGIRELLAFYNIDLFQKKVVVVGRSMLVGKPIALMCLNENATVTICHSKTSDLASETKNADVLIVAVGKPGLVGKDHVRPGQIVIDVGISRTSEDKLAGDVDFEQVGAIVEAITPVPGGVGPMTVLGLFENLVKFDQSK